LTNNLAKSTAKLMKSVHLHATALLLQEGFSWNFVFGVLPKLVDIMILNRLQTKITGIRHEEVRTFMVCRLHWGRN